MHFVTNDNPYGKSLSSWRDTFEHVNNVLLIVLFSIAFNIITYGYLGLVYILY